MDGLIGKVGIVVDGMKKMSKIVIILVCGVVVGVGVSFVFGGDFIICLDNVKFILVFVNFGFVFDIGGIYLLFKVIGVFCIMELVVIGCLVSVEEVKELGFVYKVVFVEELNDFIMKFV